MRRYLSTSKSSSTENSPTHTTTARSCSSSAFDHQSTNLQNHYSRHPEQIRDRKDYHREDKMAVTVLPSGTSGAGIMLHDYYGKYHSLSSGSALCQSMKYAETWLYNPDNNGRNKRQIISAGGSLHRPSFIRFQEQQGAEQQLIGTTRRHNHARSRIPIPCYCDSADIASGGGTSFNNSDDTTTTSTFWICRKCGGNTGAISPQSMSPSSSNTRLLSPSSFTSSKGAVIDPYDLVRQNRLAGMTVRAKSCSPKGTNTSSSSSSKPRKTSQISNYGGSDLSRQSVNSDIYGVTTDSNGKRRSILECDVNPYDLVRRNNSESPADHETSLLSEDEILSSSSSCSPGGNKKNTSKKKSYRFSLRDKFKSKIRDSKAVTAKSIFFDKLNETEDDDRKDPDVGGVTGNNGKDNSVGGGVSIAGRRIRIFSTIERSSNDRNLSSTTKDNNDDNEINNGWIRDDENEDRVAANDFLEQQLSASETTDSIPAAPLSPPRRPPRRRSSTLSHAPNNNNNNHHHHQNHRSSSSDKSIASKISKENSSSTSPSTTAVIYEVKSILKKRPQQQPEDDNCNNTSLNNNNHYGNRKNGGIDISCGGNRTNFYSETSSSAVAVGKTSSRKVKKQVQFKGTVQEIQDQDRKRVVTTRFEDESGYRNNSRLLVAPRAAYDDGDGGNAKSSEKSSGGGGIAVGGSQQTIDRTLLSSSSSRSTFDLSNCCDVKVDNEVDTTTGNGSPIYRPIPLVSIQQPRRKSEDEVYRALKTIVSSLEQQDTSSVSATEASSPIIVTTTTNTTITTTTTTPTTAGNDFYDTTIRNNVDGFDKDSLNENDRSTDSNSTSSSNETSPSHHNQSVLEINNGRTEASEASSSSSPSLMTVKTVMLQTTSLNHLTVTTTDSNFKPYLPPRQYFPFLQKTPNGSSVSSNYYSRTNSNDNNQLIGNEQPIISAATSAANDDNNVVCLRGEEKIQVPSLTKTFLKNKAAASNHESSPPNQLKSVVLVKAPGAALTRNEIIASSNSSSSSNSPTTVVVVSNNGKFSSPIGGSERGKITSVQIGESEKSDLYSVTENKVTTISIGGESPNLSNYCGGRSQESVNKIENDQHVTSIQLKSSLCNNLLPQPKQQTEDLVVNVGKISLVLPHHRHHVCDEENLNQTDSSSIIQNEEVEDDFSSSCSSEEDSLEDGGCEDYRRQSQKKIDLLLLTTKTCPSQYDHHQRENDGLHYMSTTIDERVTNYNIDCHNEHQQQRGGDNSKTSDEHIYEEISDVPPPLPKEPPPAKTDVDIVIPVFKSIFEGASKYDILKYLAVAKERGIIPEEPEEEDFVIEESSIEEEEEEEEEEDEETENTEAAATNSHSRINSLDLSSRVSQISDSSEELANLFISSSGDSCSIASDKVYKPYPDIERNDSGVGSETSKCSRSKWQHFPVNSLTEEQHMCEDCEQLVEIQVADGGLIYAPLVCCKCSKKRIERREIICEIVETEQKYRRDLRILLDEFYKPMLVAGLLSAEQLSAIFLNAEELLENSVMMAEKLGDAYEIALEQGDEDLLTVNIGQIFLDVMPMLNAFESYCTKQGSAALLLSNLEKEKELLRIFLRVSQMENTVLRRMNLNSFLMVPVQRVTKYPLLLARLYKVTPEHQTVQREQLKDAQHNIELHLEHINSLTKDISNTKLWRRISIMNGRRASGDSDDSLNFKLQRIVLEVLEWSHDDVRFVMEGKLFYAQPTDGNWKRSGRNIKVVPVNAVLVTLGKPTENYNPCAEDSECMFPRENGIKDASLLLLREKSGKFSLQREPMFLDRCIICCDNISDEFFELHEIQSKECYIFKAKDVSKTQQWYKQLQYHSHGLGRWRKRRNALANIMINGMQMRT